jgi:biopolymer transport protein ExbB/TolQ
MKSKYPSEFIFTLGALVLIAMLVQTVYATVVRPHASAMLAMQFANAKADVNFVPQRSLWVIVKDYEQETCFILLFWAITIMSYKAVNVRREQRILDSDLIRIADGVRILPDDTREYTRQIEALPIEVRSSLLPRAIRAALGRFAATRNVQDAAMASHAVCQAAADSLDSELSMLRYIAWAIPAIGFIGTVRGIGNALGQAQKAVTGDISGVTSGLGITFNSTLIALLFSIFVMFLLHSLQRTQERLVLDAETYLDEHLIRNMRSQ